MLQEFRDLDDILIQVKDMKICFESSVTLMTRPHKFRDCLCISLYVSIFQSLYRSIHATDYITMDKLQLDLEKKKQKNLLHTFLKTANLKL